jgi:type II secretory pathway pseudopilin PulG
MIELLLVMLMLTIMLAIAVPSIRGFASTGRGRDAVTQLVATALWAKSHAISEAVNVRLNVAGSSYFLSEQKETAYDRIPGEFGLDVALPEGAKVEILPFTSSRNVDPTGISFYPDGRTDPAMIRFTSETGKVTLLGCPSPAESLRVLSPEEASRL